MENRINKEEGCIGLPKVSIIILNWNTTDITGDLLRSLNRNLTYTNVEVILIDNGSSEDPSTYFSSIRKDIKLIVNPYNYGFSAGCNIGMRAATGDFFFLLNSDTEITEGLLEKLLSAFTEDATTGIVSPTVYSYFEKGKVEYAGYTSIHPITGRSKVLYNTPHAKQHDSRALSTTYFAYGAAMMIPRRVYDLVGGLCEDYFAYYEELDWSNRIREAGFKIYCHNDAIVYHKGSMSTASNTPFKTFLMARNRMLYMKRNFQGVNYYLFMIYFLIIAAPKNLLKYLFSFQIDNFIAYFKALKFHLMGQSEFLFNSKDQNSSLIRTIV